MTITTVGIDPKMCLQFTALTKMVKQFWLNPRCHVQHFLNSSQVYLPVIGMEACSGAHYWARLFRQYGHDVRLMAPKFVSIYRTWRVRPGKMMQLMQ
jgi:transposase